MLTKLMELAQTLENLSNELFSLRYSSRYNRIPTGELPGSNIEQNDVLKLTLFYTHQIFFVLLILNMTVYF